MIRIRTARHVSRLTGRVTKCEQERDSSSPPLDIRWVDEWHQRDGRLVFVELKTYETWATEVLDGDSSLTNIVIAFNPFEGSKAKRHINIDSDGDVLEGELYGNGYILPDREPLAEVEVWRSGDRRLKLRLHRKLLGKINDDYRWRAMTQYETIGEDDEGYPDCNHEFPPPRPYPPSARCRDKTRLSSST